MKLNKLGFLILLTCNLQACGQIGNHNHKKSIAMSNQELTNPIVKAAIEALQKGDSELWLSYFTEDAKLYDDGHPRNFLKFSTEAIGHEFFTSIDKVTDNGLSVFGKLHSDTWGDFKTYFKFHLNGEGKIYRLDIGQANY